MKRIILLFSMFWAINSFAQEDSTSIYYQAILHYNIKLDSLNYKENELFIEYSQGITYLFPKKVGNRLITILTSENKKEIYSRNNNKINHIIISPAWINKDKIEVWITPYVGEFLGKKVGYTLACSDWVIIQFRFDCEKGKFVYFATISGGI